MQFSFAQEKTVTGTVTSVSDGFPLPGVNVIVKGTSRGVQTDFDGNYSIKASSNETLVFSFIGMQNVEKLVGNTTVINVAMQDDTQALDEVVVIGYGSTTKKEYAGTATTIKAENIETKNYSNISQSLAGEAAGVTVINTSGQPGTTSTIRIRGFGSVNGNRAPLYVVDGIPFSGSINSINPADIKSTTILKDATATAIYGSRGANGVILITTKTGTSSESYIELDVRTGVNSQMIPRYDVIKSPEEYIGYVWEGIYNRGVINNNANPVAFANQNLFTINYVDPGYNMWNVANGGDLIDPVTRSVRSNVTRRYTPERYEDLAFSNAFRTEANLRMGGGDAKSKYFVSAGYLDDEGYALNTGYKRYTTRLNLNSKVKEWLSVGANIGYAYSENISNGQTVGSENLFEFADKMAPIFPVFLRDNNYQLVPDPVYGGNQYDYGSDSGFRARPNANNLNPIASALYDFQGADRHEVNGSFNLNLDIAEGLTFETTFGAQYSMNTFKDVRNPFYGGGRSNQGDLFQVNSETLTKNFLQLLRYKKDFGNHSLEVLAAHESNDYERSEISAYKGKAVIPSIYELDNFIVNLQPPSGYSEGRTLESYFGQVNYDFSDKYYLTASLRRDGSSRFAFDKWDTFGSVGAAWIISNESFLADNSFLTFLKVKGSYGVTGDENGVGFYTGIDTFDVSNLNGEFAFSIRNVGNPDLTWETSKQYQGGLEFNLGKYIEASVDYYIKDTDNLIFARRIPLSTGQSTITVNDGQLRNSGIEFDVTGHLITTADFSLDLNVNGAMYKNELTRMPIDPSTNEEQILTRDGFYGWTNGGSIFDYYMREWAGVDPSDGAPMWFQYFDDTNGNNQLDTGETAIQSMTNYLNANPDANVAKRVTKTYSLATDKFVGKSSIPDVAGAFRLTGKYKNFNFSTQFTYQIGGYAYDAQYGELMSDRFGAVGNNYHTDIRNRWQQPGDITSVPRLADGIDQNSTSTSTRFLIKADYLALNNILVGYTLPSKFLDNTGIDQVNLYVSGDNLFVKTERDGFNPTTREGGNTGRRLYAPLTTFTMGAKVKF